MNVDKVNHVNTGLCKPGHYQYVNMIRVDTLQPTDIHIIDIAHNLSLINRFSGALPYSVAEHSMIASSMGRLLQSQLCPNIDPTKLAAFQLRLLLHDAHEAYIGDIIKPVQEIFGYEFKLQLTRLRHFVDTQIAACIGLDSIMCPLVRRIDDQLLNFELVHFFKRDIETDYPFDIVQHEFVCYPPDEAQHHFLEAYWTLINEIVENEDDLDAPSV